MRREHSEGCVRRREREELYAKRNTKESTIPQRLFIGN